MQPMKICRPGPGSRGPVRKYGPRCDWRFLGRSTHYCTLIKQQVSGCGTVSVNSKNETQALLCWLMPCGSVYINSRFGGTQWLQLQSSSQACDCLPAPLLDNIEDGDSKPLFIIRWLKRRNTGTYTNSVVVQSNRGYIQRLQYDTVKADSHIACRAHAVPMPCRAVNSHVMPRPCHVPIVSCPSWKSAW